MNRVIWWNRTTGEKQERDYKTANGATQDFNKMKRGFGVIGVDMIITQTKDGERIKQAIWNGTKFEVRKY